MCKLTVQKKKAGSENLSSEQAATSTPKGEGTAHLCVVAFTVEGGANPTMHVRVRTPSHIPENLESRSDFA
jgi:hypothetical protein